MSATKNHTKKPNPHTHTYTHTHYKRTSADVRVAVIIFVVTFIDDALLFLVLLFALLVFLFVLLGGLCRGRVDTHESSEKGSYDLWYTNISFLDSNP